MEVLYFSTPTCGPCRYFGPALMEYLDSKGISSIKIDMSDVSNSSYKEKFQLNSVPTVVVLDNEIVVGKVVGADLKKVKELV